MVGYIRQFVVVDVKGHAFDERNGIYQIFIKTNILNLTDVFMRIYLRFIRDLDVHWMIKITITKHFIGKTVRHIEIIGKIR